ncbi:hypothetical protein VNO78_08111 [Psophocarpus tetragonolobus]|uniref:protein-serine/threonine phosphatase n=1 Tax=Psophocarpus tetragonolobus TaxID=3891 RepID=A0AAN9SXC2_PSOTE
MLGLCLRPLKMCFGGGEKQDGLLWHTDLKPHASGNYSIAVVQANSSLEDQAQVFTSPSATFVGVYDGHGGPEASRFIISHLFSFLRKLHEEEGGLSEEVIKKAFEATEEEFLRFVKQSWVARPQIASVGSCCLLGAISNGVLYVANLGDSRAVLGRKNATAAVAERLSTDHNVGVEEVRKEVEALHPDDAHIVVCTRGVWRIKGIIQCLKPAGLARGVSDADNDDIVSRSIGDVYLKKPEFETNPLFQQFACPLYLKRPVMSAEPSILKRKLNADDLYLIFASDGLWDNLTDQAAVEIIFRSPRIGIAKRLVRAALEEVAKKREMRYEDLRKIEKGLRRHFHDDITVIVLYLDHTKESQNGRSRHQGVYDCTNTPIDIFSLRANEGEL